jgi:hypothetical protein
MSKQRHEKTRLEYLQDARDEGRSEAQKEIDKYFFGTYDPSIKRKIKSKKKRISNEDDLWW